MEIRATYPADLEIRQRGGARILSGRFPYGRTATVADRGRRRKERIGPDAFGWQIRRFAELQQQLADVVGEAIDEARRQILQESLERANVHVLAGHDFNKPLGDMKRGTARVSSTRDSLDFEVDLPDDADMPTYMLDTVKEIRTGRAGGISPGFRVPPANVVPNAEENMPEPGNPGVMIRQIYQAVLYEVSIVSRPAYGSTDVDLRAEDFGIEPVAKLENPDWRRRAARWLSI